MRILHSALLYLGLSSCACMAHAQIVSLPHGARITIDSITTEVTVLSPTTVEVTKYIGERPQQDEPVLKIAAGELADSLPRVEGGGKIKIDGGNYYAALNLKDGNVSFWGHDGNLIMAEQHRTASMTRRNDVDQTGNIYEVSQDFQIGLSDATSVTCPVSTVAPAVNLKGRRAEFGSETDGLPVPYIVTDKGYGILWSVSGPGRMDDTPGRRVRKSGDVTFTSDSADSIHYYFIYPATVSE